jgi:hypothetical protein
LHEQILLLALRDEAGTLERRAGMHGYALAGAILSELLLEGCIAVPDDKKKVVELVRVKNLHDPVLDESLGLIAAARRRRRASDWVWRFTRLERLRHRVAEQLCRRGVLKDSEATVLLLFKRKVYPTIDPAPERRLVERLRRAIFSDEPSIDPATAIVAALAHSTGLLSVHFERKALKQRKRRLAAVLKGQLVAAATREAVQAAQTAAMVGALVASVAAASASS